MIFRYERAAFYRLFVRGWLGGQKTTKPKGFLNFANVLFLSPAGIFLHRNGPREEWK